MTRTIDVSDLPEPLVVAIESLVSTYREKTNGRGESVGPRPVGWLKGKVHVPDTFFDPLPDDLLDLFEGGGRNGGEEQKANW